MPIDVVAPKIEPVAPPPSPVSEVKACVRPPPLEIVEEDDDIVEHSISESFADEIERMKAVDEEKERQQEQLMIKLREAYEAKMKQLQEEKDKLDEVIRVSEREAEIKKKIEKNQQLIQKIQSQKKQKEKSDIFARLSSGKSSVEKASLLGKKKNDSLKRPL